MDNSQLTGEFENTIEDALALCLRRIMAQNGKPERKDYRDPELFEAHMRQWDHAKTVLAAYDKYRA